MGNCLQIFRKRKYDKHIHLLLIGLDNAGKSSTANFLSGQPTKEVLKTVGFRAINLYHRKIPVTIYDVGGSPQVRGIWPLYYADVHGIIFVIDASDRSRFEECANVLDEVLSHKQVSGKPILILANKQDIPGAIDDLDIVEMLNIESIVNRDKCPTRVEAYTTNVPIVKKKKKKIDPGLHNGYFWLLNYIIHRYGTLNLRVQSDINIEREKRKKAEPNKEDQTQKKSEANECNSGSIIMVKEANTDIVSIKSNVKLSPLFGNKNVSNKVNKEIELEPRSQMRKLSPIVRKQLSLTNSSGSKEKPFPSPDNASLKRSSADSRTIEVSLANIENPAPNAGNKIILPPITTKPEVAISDEMKKIPVSKIKSENENSDDRPKSAAESIRRQLEITRQPSLKSIKSNKTSPIITDSNLYSYDPEQSQS